MSAHRAVSTVVDVALCMLLVSASVGVLATADPPEATTENRPPPRDVAGVMGAATAEITYTVDSRNRVARGTLADLLAHVARIDARAGGATSGFRAGVRRETARTLDSVAGPAQVVAVWRPYPGAERTGRVAAGEEPPPGANVAAASITVPLGAANASRETESFGALGRRIAGRLHPPGPHRTALAARFEDRLRARYADPDAAAAELTADRVRVVVRTWSP